MEMKRKIKTMLFSIIIILSVTVSVNCIFADSYDGPSPNGEPAYIAASDGYANIRKGAGTKYEIIDKLDNGTIVRVFGSIKNKKGEKWYCIDNNNKQERTKGIFCGWTHESNIKLGEKDIEK